MKTKPDDLVLRSEVLAAIEKCIPRCIDYDEKNPMGTLSVVECGHVDAQEIKNAVNAIPAYDPWHGPEEEPEEGRPCIFQSALGTGTGVASAEGFQEWKDTDLYFASLNSVERWMYVPLPEEADDGER
jgi:hypothetical protein